MVAQLVMTQNSYFPDNVEINIAEKIIQLQICIYILMNNVVLATWS